MRMEGKSLRSDFFSCHASVGSCQWQVLEVALCFAVGSSTIIAIYLGQRKQEQAGNVFSQNLVTVSVLSLVMTLSE